MREERPNARFPITKWFDIKRRMAADRPHFKPEKASDVPQKTNRREEIS